MLERSCAACTATVPCHLGCCGDSARGEASTGLGVDVAVWLEWQCATSSRRLCLIAHACLSHRERVHRSLTRSAGVASVTTSRVAGTVLCEASCAFDGFEVWPPPLTPQPRPSTTRPSPPPAFSLSSTSTKPMPA